MYPSNKPHGHCTMGAPVMATDRCGCAKSGGNDLAAVDMVKTLVQVRSLVEKKQASCFSISKCRPTAHPALKPTAVDPSPLFLGPFSGPKHFVLGPLKHIGCKATKNCARASSGFEGSTFMPDCNSCCVLLCSAALFNSCQKGGDHGCAKVYHSGLDLLQILSDISA
eukprot:1147386-Pelagomonas_calceolata.AAC.2